jgi:hypothetical protein
VGALIAAIVRVGDHAGGPNESHVRLSAGSRHVILEFFNPSQRLDSQPCRGPGDCSS